MPLRNSLHRRSHKERSQLSHRTKLGLLEKHKDYVQRARDYKSKKERLRTLRSKAEERNKDEFYFGMNGKKTEKGVEYRKREGDGMGEAMGQDMVKILKSQDAGYLGNVRRKNVKRMDAIKAQLTAMVDLVPTEGDVDEMEEDVVEQLREAGVLPPARKAKGKGRALAAGAKHIVFVDNEDEAKKYAGPTSTNNSIDSEDEWASESSDNDDDMSDGDKYASQRAQKQESKRKAEAKKHRVELLHELSARLKRDTALRHAIRELEMQRHLMGPGTRTKVRGPERADAGSDSEDSGERTKKRGQVKFARQGEVDYAPRVYKWRSERRR
ncbi:hypothetical protein BDV93DRAFT_107826 [Ceratobasidium sp. AG-I]|nr:hypothetical protein BDV93DRAFT_107826 [Ceratobasidium sp. AG-I]